MKISKASQIQRKDGSNYGGQDGAIYKDYLFRFNPKGLCRVYDMKSVAEGGDITPIAEFSLDKGDVMLPHSNAVVFGKEFYAEGDEFPLLYSNIYNNYSKEEDNRLGICCVYRLERDGEGFKTTLVQIIEIGFTDDTELWNTTVQDKPRMKAYGNFAVDAEKGIYYGFVMRGSSLGTRYFAFELPRLDDGELDMKYGVKKVILKQGDIKKQFDCPEHYYLQGACFHGGLIYSVEGFQGTAALRVIDPEKGEQVLHVNFPDYGLDEEAEFIDFYNGQCYYGDCPGSIFLLEF